MSNITKSSVRLPDADFFWIIPCILQNKSLNVLDALKYKSAASRVQLADLSQLQDGISLTSYPAVEELESALRWSQL